MRFFLIGCLVVFLGCKQGKKYHDEKKREVVVTNSEALADIIRFQKGMDAQFKDPETSPLPDKYRKDFEGLDFFPADTTYVVTAKLIRSLDAVPFLMPTTTTRKSEEVVYGIAHFRLKGKDHRLEIYRSIESMEDDQEDGDVLFLPFTDQTNGEATYMGGRYLDLGIPTGDSIVLDFNRAYSPYCAYNKKFSCPLVPSVNALDIKVEAGVKLFDPANE